MKLLNKTSRILLAILVFGLLVIFSNLFLWKNIKNKDIPNVQCLIEINNINSESIQIFYSETMEFKEEYSKTYDVNDQVSTGIFKVSIPVDTNYLRVDIGENLSNLTIKNLDLDLKSDLYHIDLILENYNSVNHIKTKNDYIQFDTLTDDPYVVLNITSANIVKLVTNQINNYTLIRKIVSIVFVDILIFILFLFRRKLKFSIKQLLANHNLIWDLAKNDFRTRFAGSYLGVVWAFVQPIVTLLVYWFVFQVGFNSGDKNGAPYALWLSVGLIPWFYFSEAWNLGSNSLLEYSYLVKKVVFNIDIIPWVKMISAFFVHLFFIFLVIIILLLKGVNPTLYWTQILYYMICNIAILNGLIYLSCSLVVFFRDLSQIIALLLQIGIWVTPIMWDSEILPDTLNWILKMNPMYYIINGYRESLLYDNWFWNNTYGTIGFWVFTIIITLIGYRMFRKLKVHFADVL